MELFLAHFFDTMYVEMKYSDVRCQFVRLW